MEMRVILSRRAGMCMHESGAEGEHRDMPAINMYDSMDGAAWPARLVCLAHCCTCARLACMVGSSSIWITTARCPMTDPSNMCLQTDICLACSCHRQS